MYESKVETGRLDRHPVKRTRTTLTYLAVASLATDEEKKLYRRAVNGSHKQVRSDENSAVEYNAFDPELQLWVAACLYRGFEDVYKILYGDLDPVTRDAFYQRSATFGTNPSDATRHVAGGPGCVRGLLEREPRQGGDRRDDS